MIREGLIQCLPGADIGCLEALSAGWETDVYGFTADGQPLVLRVYSGGDVWERATPEVRAMQLVHGLGYPVPRLVAFSEDRSLFGGSYLIMERIAIQAGQGVVNLLLRGPDGEPYVIDWSCAALDDPRVDVAQAMVLAITNGNPGFAEKVRQGYEALHGGPLPHLDFFVLVALARRVTTMAVTMVCGSAALGLRPGLEGQLRRAAPQMLQALGLLEQMSGVVLPAVRSAMEQAAQLG